MASAVRLRIYDKDLIRDYINSDEPILRLVQISPFLPPEDEEDPTGINGLEKTYGKSIRQKAKKILESLIEDVLVGGDKAPKMPVLSKINGLKAPPSGTVRRSALDAITNPKKLAYDWSPIVADLGNNSVDIDDVLRRAADRAYRYSYLLHLLHHPGVDKVVGVIPSARYLDPAEIGEKMRSFERLDEYMRTRTSSKHVKEWYERETGGDHSDILDNSHVDGVRDARELFNPEDTPMRKTKSAATGVVTDDPEKTKETRAPRAIITPGVPKSLTDDPAAAQAAKTPAKPAKRRSRSANAEAAAAEAQDRPVASAPEGAPPQETKPKSKSKAKSATETAPPEAPPPAPPPAAPAAPKAPTSAEAATAGSKRSGSKGSTEKASPRLRTTTGQEIVPSGVDSGVNFSNFITRSLASDNGENRILDAYRFIVRMLKTASQESDTHGEDISAYRDWVNDVSKKFEGAVQKSGRDDLLESLEKIRNDETITGFRSKADIGSSWSELSKAVGRGIGNKGSVWSKMRGMLTGREWIPDSHDEEASPGEDKIREAVSEVRKEKPDSTKEPEQPPLSLFDTAPEEEKPEPKGEDVIKGKVREVAEGAPSTTSEPPKVASGRTESKASEPGRLRELAKASAQEPPAAPAQPPKQAPAQPKQVPEQPKRASMAAKPSAGAQPMGRTSGGIVLPISEEEWKRIEEAYSRVPGREDVTGNKSFGPNKFYDPIHFDSMPTAYRYYGPPPSERQGDPNDYGIPEDEFRRRKKLHDEIMSDWHSKKNIGASRASSNDPGGAVARRIRTMSDISTALNILAHDPHIRVPSLRTPSGGWLAGFMGELRKERGDTGGGNVDYGEALLEYLKRNGIATKEVIGRYRPSGTIPTYKGWTPQWSRWSGPDTYDVENYDSLEKLKTLEKDVHAPDTDTSNKPVEVRKTEPAKESRETDDDQKGLDFGSSMRSPRHPSPSVGGAVDERAREIKRRREERAKDAGEGDGMDEILKNIERISGEFLRSRHEGRPHEPAREAQQPREEPSRADQPSLFGHPDETPPRRQEPTREALEDRPRPATEAPTDRGVREERPVPSRHFEEAVRDPRATGDLGKKIAHAAIRHLYGPKRSGIGPTVDDPYADLGAHVASHLRKAAQERHRMAVTGAVNRARERTDRLGAYEGSRDPRSSDFGRRTWERPKDEPDVIPVGASRTPGPVPAYEPWKAAEGGYKPKEPFLRTFYPDPRLPRMKQTPFNVMKSRVMGDRPEAMVEWRKSPPKWYRGRQYQSIYDGRYCGSLRSLMEDRSA